MTYLTDIIVAGGPVWIPAGFVAIGLLLAGIRLMGSNRTSATVEVDPDIRVRVTGRIS